MMRGKKASLLWIAAGLIFSLLTLLVVLHGLMGKIVITDPEGIPTAADQAMTCIQSGDWSALECMVSGKPSLTPATGEHNSVTGKIWEAYQKSLQWTFQEAFSVEGSYVIQGIHVTCLDIGTVIKDIAELTMASVDANEDQRQQLQFAAAEQILNTEPPLMQRRIELTFLREDGQWLLVPNKALQEVLSGFTIH